MAASLEISLYTVETHRGNLMEKLNLHGVEELIFVRGPQGRDFLTPGTSPPALYPLAGRPPSRRQGMGLRPPQRYSRIAKKKGSCEMRGDGLGGEVPVFWNRTKDDMKFKSEEQVL